VALRPHTQKERAIGGLSLEAPYHGPFGVTRLCVLSVCAGVSDIPVARTFFLLSIYVAIPNRCFGTGDVDNPHHITGATVPFFFIIRRRYYVSWLYYVGSE
jgi:hypothetical protein